MHGIQSSLTSSQDLDVILGPRRMESNEEREREGWWKQGRVCAVLGSSWLAARSTDVVVTGVELTTTCISKCLVDLE